MYATESFIVSTGVSSSVSIHSDVSIPTALSTTPRMPQKMSAVVTQVCTCFISFCPNKFAVTTDVPMLQPNAMAMKISVISELLPTAASASVLMKCPATKLSAML